MKTTVIAEQAQLVLVEWRDAAGPHRAWLPRPVREDMTYAELLAGVPHGIDWENAACTVTGGDIARALRERGIWTEADLGKNLGAAIAALQEAYGLDLASLIHYARTARQEAEHE